ncbi:hypothetical protein [Mycolicibacterium mengxianglii]|nr:hypothetical protein [Mycolicibacterium mengxianglii]
MIPGQGDGLGVVALAEKFGDLLAGDGGHGQIMMAKYGVTDAAT